MGFEFALDALGDFPRESKHDSAGGTEVDVLGAAVIDPAALAVRAGLAPLGIDIEVPEVGAASVVDGPGEVLTGKGGLKCPIGKGLAGAKLEELAQGQIMVGTEVILLLGEDTAEKFGFDE